MSGGPITIKDIAKALNISISTVSRALKNHRSISVDTRKMVNDYATKHHYKPNALATSMRTGRSSIVGVIVPEIMHNFFAMVIDGIEEVAEENDLHIILCQSLDQYVKEVKCVETFLSTRVCGVLASLAKETTIYDHYQELVDRNIPTVFFDRICTGIQTDRVVVDDYAGSFSAVDYMIKSGCRRIAFFCSPLHMEIAKNRKAGYMDALRRNGIPSDPDLIYICDDREHAIRLVPEVMNTETHPDAFFAINDATAAGILFVVKRMGFKVPSDVSICGFTDGFIAQNTDPQLTTVGQSGQDIGRNAMELLLARINGTVDPNRINNRIIKTKLIVRGSTR